jgi:hypothetical protein
MDITEITFDHELDEGRDAFLPALPAEIVNAIADVPEPAEELLRPERENAKPPQTLSAALAKLGKGTNPIATSLRRTPGSTAASTAPKSSSLAPPHPGTIKRLPSTAALVATTGVPVANKPLPAKKVGAAPVAPQLKAKAGAPTRKPPPSTRGSALAKAKAPPPPSSSSSAKAKAAATGKGKGKAAAGVSAKQLPFAARARAIPAGKGVRAATLAGGSRGKRRGQVEEEEEEEGSYSEEEEEGSYSEEEEEGSYSGTGSYSEEEESGSYSEEEEGSEESGGGSGDSGSYSEEESGSYDEEEEEEEEEESTPRPRKSGGGSRDGAGSRRPASKGGRDSGSRRPASKGGSGSGSRRPSSGGRRAQEPSGLSRKAALASRRAFVQDDDEDEEEGSSAGEEAADYEEEEEDDEEGEYTTAESSETPPRRARPSSSSSRGSKRHAAAPIGASPSAKRQRAMEESEVLALAIREQEKALRGLKRDLKVLRQIEAAWSIDEEEARKQGIGAQDLALINAFDDEDVAKVREVIGKVAAILETLDSEFGSQLRSYQQSVSAMDGILRTRAKVINRLDKATGIFSRYPDLSQFVATKQARLADAMENTQRALLDGFATSLAKVQMTQGQIREVISGAVKGSSYR